jgi:hypothetical protein
MKYICIEKVMEDELEKPLMQWWIEKLMNCELFENNMLNKWQVISKETNDKLITLSVA